MLRVIAITLALILAASLTALAYCWGMWNEENIRIETPKRMSPKTITTSYKTEEGIIWTATLALSADGQLQEVQLDCDGRPYAIAPRWG
jgi:hypothetical protein